MEPQTRIWTDKEGVGEKRGDGKESVSSVMSHTDAAAASRSATASSASAASHPAHLPALPTAGSRGPETASRQKQTARKGTPRKQEEKGEVREVFPRSLSSFSGTRNGPYSLEAQLIQKDINRSHFPIGGKNEDNAHFRGQGQEEGMRSGRNPATDLQWDGDDTVSDLGRPDDHTRVLEARGQSRVCEIDQNESAGALLQGLADLDLTRFDDQVSEISTLYSGDKLKKEDAKGKGMRSYMPQLEERSPNPKRSSTARIEARATSGHQVRVGSPGGTQGGYRQAEEAIANARSIYGSPRGFSGANRHADDTIMNARSGYGSPRGFQEGNRHVECTTTNSRRGYGSPRGSSRGKDDADTTISYARSGHAHIDSHSQNNVQNQQNAHFRNLYRRFRELSSSLQAFGMNGMDGAEGVIQMGLRWPTLNNSDKSAYIDHLEFLIEEMREILKAQAETDRTRGDKPTRHKPAHEGKYAHTSDAIFASDTEPSDSDSSTPTSSSSSSSDGSSRKRKRRRGKRRKKKSGSQKKKSKAKRARSKPEYYKDSHASRLAKTRRELYKQGESVYDWILRLRRLCRESSWSERRYCANLLRCYQRKRNDSHAGDLALSLPPNDPVFRNALKAELALIAYYDHGGAHRWARKLLTEKQPDDETCQHWIADLQLKVERAHLWAPEIVPSEEIAAGIAWEGFSNKYALQIKFRHLRKASHKVEVSWDDIAEIAFQADTQTNAVRSSAASVKTKKKPKVSKVKAEDKSYHISSSSDSSETDSSADDTDDDYVWDHHVNIALGDAIFAERKGSRHAVRGDGGKVIKRIRAAVRAARRMEGKRDRGPSPLMVTALITGRENLMQESNFQGKVSLYVKTQAKSKIGVVLSTLPSESVAKVTAVICLTCSARKHSAHMSNVTATGMIALWAHFALSLIQVTHTFICLQLAVGETDLSERLWRSLLPS